MMVVPCPHLVDSGSTSFFLRHVGDETSSYPTCCWSHSKGKRKQFTSCFFKILIRSDQIHHCLHFMNQKKKLHGWPGVSEFQDVSHCFGKMKQTVTNATICCNFLEYGKVCKTHLTCASVLDGMGFTDQCFKWEPQRSLNFKEIMWLGYSLVIRHLHKTLGSIPCTTKLRQKFLVFWKRVSETAILWWIWQKRREEKGSPLSRASFWQRICTVIQEIRQRHKDGPLMKVKGAALIVLRAASLRRTWKW